jgi:acid phosphatase
LLTKSSPEVLYNSVATSPDRLAKIKNTTLFFEDLKANKLPQWLFVSMRSNIPYLGDYLLTEIAPNMTSDGHDTSVTTAGVWLRNFLEPLLSNSNFLQNTLVLITFDENETYAIQNRVFSILLGDAVPKELVGTTDPNYYNHYSEISTVEANW